MGNGPGAALPLPTLSQVKGNPFKLSKSYVDWHIEEASSTRLSITEALELGRMRITIIRIKREKRRVPRSMSGLFADTVKEVPEKALKGRSVANTVR